MKNYVLLVDDNPSNLLVFEHTLAELDLTCIKASSASEAYSALNNYNISLILLDVQMPDIDGFDTLTSIRLNKKWEDIPVIMISAVYKADKFKIKGIQLGALDFIIKPIIPELLAAKVQTFLELYEYRKKTEQELKRSQISLTESEDLFKTLSEATFESIFLSSEGKCIMQNKTAEEMFGYTLDEAIGKYGTMWIVPEDRDLVKGKMLAGKNDRYSVMALRKDGTSFPCEVKGRMSQHRGKPIRITSLTDISERVTAQKKLVQREKQYRSLLQDNLSVIMVINPNTGEIVEVNNACCKFYGYSREKMLSMSIYNINTLDKSKINKEMQCALNNDRNYFIFKHRLSEDRICDVEVYAGKIEYHETDMLLSVIHDITEKIKTRKELVIAKERAEESDRLKTSFLANMSHEIRTPMNAILGFSQLLSIPEISEEDKTSYLETITNSGKHLLRLIDDIISISQIEAGIININYESISTEKILLSIHKLFTLHAEEKGLSFSYHNLIPVENSLVSTDPRRLQQILINLISNALKFTNTGSIEFGCNLVDDNIEFYVKDTGIGIKKGDEEIIFERFMQSEQENDILYGGTGIGLSISKAIVELLGGRIWVVTNCEKGSEFRFTIPATNYTEEEIITLPESSDFPDYTDKTVLIAEDEPHNYQLVKILLTHCGANVLWAKNGLEVLKIMEENKKIDLILMDIKMPIRDGLETTIEIRKTNQEIPIIAQTAYAQLGDQEKTVMAGCNSYIAKPIQKSQLFKVISKYINFEN